VRPFTSVVAFLLVLTVTLALILPMALLSPPRDNEVWLYQSISEMHDGARLVPTLNGERMTGQSPLTLTGFSFIPQWDITAQRIVPCLLGCMLVASVFFFSLSLWGIETAAASSLIVVTSLGFLALYGTLNLSVLPVTLVVAAYLLFSIVYLKGARRSWYLVSYLLAGAATVSGGFTMLAFFFFGVLLLILLDLAPAQFLSIHLIAGAVIIAVLLLAFALTYRIALGPDAVSGLLSPGEDLGFFTSLKAYLTYAAPWILLVIPAWVHGEGPGDQQVWRTLLPPRIAFVLGLLVLWLSSRCLPQYAVVAMPFGAMIIGRWIACDILRGKDRGWLASLTILASGILVFGAAFVLFLLFPLHTGSIGTGQIATLAGFGLAALIFFALVIRRKLLAGLVLTVIAVACAAWGLAWLNPEDQWEQKIAFMQGVSRSSPLVVYEDDLVMRGFLGAVGSRPVVMQRSAVPIEDTAFLAVTTTDLEELVDSLKPRMHPVVLDTYRAENTYALLMISPKKRLE